MPAPSISAVGLLSPGDMGHSVGAVLTHNGMTVHTCLTGRSSRSAELAKKANLQPVDSLENLVESVDLFLSIIPPSRATELAEQVANAVKATRTSLVYLDCNAIAPETTKQVGEIVTSAGCMFVDGGIIGAPPKIDAPGPRIYVSGPDTSAAEALAEYGLDIRPIGTDIGEASAVKMCYAALTKGLTALGTELLVAAEALGVSKILHDEFEHSQQQLLRHFEKQIPTMPPKAYRWVGEMEEIAKTFQDVGMTPKILLGAADMYRMVEATPLGQETPEHRSRGETLTDVVEILRDELPS